MAYFLQQSLNVLQLGSIYALIALGYSLVYGILRFFNFAHGDLFMTGAFVALVGVISLHFGFLLSIIFAMLGAGALSVFIERVAYRPLRGAPKASMMITALASGLILEQLVLMKYPYPQYVPPLLINTIWNWHGVAFTSLQCWIVLVSVGLMLCLDWMSRKTLLGLAQRAVACNGAVVPLVGIPLNRVIAYTFAISGALAGAAGMLYAQAYPIIDPYIGVGLGWKAFVAAVIGGIGNIRGAMFGAFLLATVEIFSIVLFPSSYRDLSAFSLLVVFLIFRPYGIFGRALVEKV